MDKFKNNGNEMSEKSTFINFDRSKSGYIGADEMQTITIGAMAKNSKIFNDTKSNFNSTRRAQPGSRHFFENGMGLNGLSLKDSQQRLGGIKSALRNNPNNFSPLSQRLEPIITE